jgi:hypothetical protein
MKTAAVIWDASLKNELARSLRFVPSLLPDLPELVA